MVDSIIFDLDGTLTRVPSPWQYVHERLGVWHGVASGFLEEWLSGDISYEEFCRRDFELWKGVSLGEIQSLLDEIEINPHLAGIVERLRETPIQSIVISSGFRHVARRIQADLGWQPLCIHANDLVEGPEVRIHVSADSDSPLSKTRMAERALEEACVSPARCLVVSDSHRDLEMMSACRYRLLIENEDDLLEVYRFIES